MKDFTMSMYASEKDLYKAKAEYYEDQLDKALDMLKRASHALRNTGSSLFYLEVLKCIEEIESGK